MKARAGFTLTECALAGAILALTALALLEGVINSTNIAMENSRLLAADSYAFDLAWQRYNMQWTTPGTAISTKTLTSSEFDPEESVPILCAEAWPKPTVKVTVSPVYETIGNAIEYHGKTIGVDLEWGPSKRRRTSHAEVFRAALNRWEGS